MRGSRDRPTSASAYSYPTAAPQPGRQYLQRGDLHTAAPLITAGHALQLREQHAQQQPPHPSAPPASRDARPMTATAALQSSSGNKFLFAQAAASQPPSHPQQPGQVHSAASIKRPSSGTASASAYAAYPASNSSLVSPAMLAAGASHSGYNSGSISAAAAGPSGAAAQPSTVSVLAAAAATGRRQVMAAGAAAAAVAASSAGAAAIPAPSQHQQHRAVNAIREQLHQLSVSAAPSSSTAPRTSPTSSPLPGLSPRNSSDGGSDDGLSDMAPSPSPSPLAMQHARTASAVSSRLGERSSFPSRNDPPGQRSYAFTPSEPDSQAALARRGIAGPLITASLEPFQPNPSPSPPPPAAASLSSPSPSPSPLQQSRFFGDSHAPQQSLLQRSVVAGPSNPHETVIHVCDENRGIQQDFRCDRALLVAGMRYFAAYLTVPSAAGSSNSTSAAQQEEIDISVHCDVLIFEWLLLWIAWERSIGLYDSILGPSKAAAAASKQAKSAAAPKPSLDVNNVVSILISSDFLGMVRLVDECLAFVAANLSAVVRTPVDLACLSDELVRTMVQRHLSDEIDGSLEAMRKDTEEPISGHSRKPSASVVSPLAGLQQLCALRDRKSKIAPRLWMFKTEALLAARSGGIGASSSSSSLQQCAHCSELFWTSPSSDDESLQYCASPLSRFRIDFHGVLHSRHVASRTWSARKWLLSLRVAEGLEWEEIFWRVVGVVHSIPNTDDAASACCCERCGAKGFSYAALRSCRFHVKEAIMMKPREAGSIISSAAPQLTYPCCGTPAGLFASSTSSAAGASAGGCRVRVHELKPRGRKARALHEMALQHVDQICPLPAAPQTDSEDPAASPTAAAKKRVNIVLANNQTQSFGPGASTIKPASPIATAAATAPSILGPSVAAALASYSSDAAAPSTKPAGIRRSLSSRRARALRGLDPDGPSDDDTVAASADDRSSAGSGSEDDDDEDDEEEYEDDEEEHSDSDDGRRRRGAARRSHAATAAAKTPAARAAAAAERLRFKPGYESSNPHGHAPKRPASQVSQRQQQQQQQQGQGRGSAQFESTVPPLKLNSLAEKALSQLRDVMSESQFQTLHDQLLAGQQQQMQQQQQANRTTSGPGFGSQASSSSVKTAARAPSAGPIRVASRKAHQPSGSHKPSQQQQQPTRAVKSILKSPTSGAEVHIPSASSAGASSSSALHAFSAWDAASSGAAVSRSPDGSPPRSPSKPRVRSSYALDAAFEDDRQRMSAIITDLTHSRGAQQQAQVTHAAAAAQARSASTAPPSRLVDRGAQARRPYK